MNRMTRKTMILINIIYFFLLNVSVAQKPARICQDTLKGQYSINRVSSVFLNDIGSYEKNQFIVVERECNQLINTDTLNGYLKVVCTHADIYYSEDVVDSVYQNIRDYLYYLKASTTELYFNLLSTERGIIFCLSAYDRFIRIIPVDACLEKKHFNRIIQRLRKNKDFKKVCFLRCDAKNFEEFNIKN